MGCLLILSACSTTSKYVGRETGLDNTVICKIGSLPQPCYFTENGIYVDYTIDKTETAGEYVVYGTIEISSGGRNLEVTQGHIDILLLEQTPTSYRVYDCLGTNLFGNRQNKLKFKKSFVSDQQPAAITTAASWRGKSY